MVLGFLIRPRVEVLWHCFRWKLLKSGTTQPIACFAGLSLRERLRLYCSMAVECRCQSFEVMTLTFPQNAGLMTVRCFEKIRPMLSHFMVTHWFVP